MITLTKSGNAIVFTFDDNDHYLNDGTIEVPVNSLTLVTDESQMATFRKSASNDIFISATYGELGMSKADLESWFKENACGSTGVTPEEVQDMIDESISGLAESSAVTEEITAAVSGKADSSVVTSLNGVVTGHTADTTIHVTSNDKEKWNKVDDKLDASAYTPTDLSQYWTSAETENAITAAVSGKADTSDVQNVASDVSTVSGDVNTLSGSVESLTGAVNTISGDVSTLSGQVETDEKVTATALNALNNGLSGATTSINNVSSTLNNHTGNSEIHISSADRNNWDGKVGYEDVTNTVQKDSNELVEGGGIFNKVAYTTTASSVVTGETTNTRIGTYNRFNGSWANLADTLQDWCWDENICDLDGGELRMSFNNDISELDITIGDLGGNSFTVRYDSNEDNLEADNATVEWADATTKREIIITDYPTISLEELDGELTSDATVIPVEDRTTYVYLKYVYSSEQTIETTHWVVDEIKDKADTSAVTASIAAAVSGKQDTLIAGSGITIDSANTISCTVEGGGKAIVAGTNISVTTGATADTINCTLPIGVGTGSQCILIGQSNSTDLQDFNCLLVGKNNILGYYQNEVFCCGDNNSPQEIRCNSSQILGSYNKVRNAYEFASGRYNNPNRANTTFGDSGNTLFSVGNGTANNARHNAFEIRQNGDIYCSDGTNDVKLQDTITATAANTTALGGLKLVQISQSDYDALATKDASTLYIITNNS